MNKENKDIIETLKLLPLRIKQQTKRLYTFAFEIEHTKMLLQKTQDDILKMINEKKDENNKPVFSNEAMRQIELRKIMERDEQTQTLLKELETAEGNYRDEKTELEYQQNLLSAMRAISRILGANQE